MPHQVGAQFAHKMTQSRKAILKEKQATKWEEDQDAGRMLLTVRNGLLLINTDRLPEGKGLVKDKGGQIYSDGR